jgi:hypothetical protein
MSSRELADWEAEYSLEPWGEWRMEFANARLMQLVAVAAGNADATVSDFMPRFAQAANEEAEQDLPDPEELQRKAMRLHMLMGGTIEAD